MSTRRITFALMWLCCSAGPAYGRPGLRVPLEIKIARCQQRLVRSRAWVQKQVAAAKKIFQHHGIELAVTISSFKPERCELQLRAHRHAMAAHVPRIPQVTVLLVKRVADLDVPGYNLMGVHWRYAGRNKTHSHKRWVLLTARAKPPVLAHELCHYFGLPHHRAGGNLMTPGPSDPAWRSKKRPAPFAPRLTPKQVRRLRRNVRRFIETKSETKPKG